MVLPGMTFHVTTGKLFSRKSKHWQVKLGIVIWNIAATSPETRYIIFRKIFFSVDQNWFAKIQMIYWREPHAKILEKQYQNHNQTRTKTFIFNEYLTDRNDASVIIIYYNLRMILENVIWLKLFPISHKILNFKMECSRGFSYIVLC